MQYLNVVSHLVDTNCFICYNILVNESKMKNAHMRLKKNITCGMKKLGFMWEQLAEKCI